MWPKKHLCGTAYVDNNIYKIEEINYIIIDLQVNNMCEAFNRAILGLREKPIITLHEGIKHYITVRIVKQMQMLERCNGDICPKIQVLIEKNKRAAGGWKATWHGDMEMVNFSVTNETDKYVVNLTQKTCAYRKWDLTGIPCAHVIPCIWHNGLACHLTICNVLSLIFCHIVPSIMFCHFVYMLILCRYLVAGNHNV